MSFRVIEKRDDNITVAILENDVENLTHNESSYYSEPINISLEPLQNIPLNKYLTNKSEQRSLIIKPNQNSTKSNYSHENNLNKIGKNLNTIQTEQQIIKPNPPSPNQTPRRFNTSKLHIDSKKTEVEQTIKRPNTTQKPQTIEKPNKFNSANQTPRRLNTTNNTEQAVKMPNTAQTTKKIKMPNTLPANKTPRKVNTSNKTEIKSIQIQNDQPNINSKSNSSIHHTKKNSNHRNHIFNGNIFKRPDLLPPRLQTQENKITLVLDLDETLVHSNFFFMSKCDFSFMADQHHYVSVCVRPGVKDFILKMGKLYELVLFTVGNNIYASRIIDHIDPQRIIKHRLYRDSCTFSRGNFVKDLSRLGRELDRIIIVDDSPISYRFQPYNALPISSWIGDPNDDELIRIQNFLIENHQVDKVYNVLSDYRSKYKPPQKNVNSFLFTNVLKKY